jgi:hypothetical protein
VDPWTILGWIILTAVTAAAAALTVGVVIAVWIAVEDVIQTSRHGRDAVGTANPWDDIRGGPRRSTASRAGRDSSEGDR